jgi:hypothetical protein
MTARTAIQSCLTATTASYSAVTGHSLAPEVCGPEALAPLRHAVRLIHAHQRQRAQAAQALHHGPR